MKLGNDEQLSCLWLPNIAPTRPVEAFTTVVSMVIRSRLALLLPGGLALLLGLDAALLLLELPAPLSWERLPEAHGLLLTLGAVGTLVALERAVALNRWWGFLAPAGLGLGGLSLVTRVPVAVCGSLLTLGAVVLVAVYVALWRRQPADAVVVQAGGAAMAVSAALLWWAGVPVPVLLPWLAGFLILTILGERLELARIAIDARAAATTAALAGLFCVAMLGALLWPVPGYAALGATLLALTGWMAGHDVARRTVHTTGLPQYMAACLLAGYAWLGVTGAIWLVAGAQLDGPGYDAVVHTVFLGFVMSMVMAHAPVILPAVLRVQLPYRFAMYIPVVMLHASLLLRVLLGDGYGIAWAWRLGGALNIVALLAFVGVAVWSAATAPARGPERRRDPAVAGGQS